MPGDPLTLGDGVKAALVGPDGKVKARVTAISSERERVTRILSSEERQSRPRCRPVRHEYQHTCGGTTRIGIGIAETFAIDPTFYSTTYCVHCACYLPVREFTWTADGALVGV